MRKDLCMPGFIQAIRNKFLKIPDPRQFSRPNQISFIDCLLSCFAVFNLKWPSLLQYEEETKNPNVLKNLKDLFLISRPPSDTYMRERLDELDPLLLRPSFNKVFAMAQRGKVLEEYQFLDGYYILNQAESWNLGCVKAPGLNRSKEIPYYNMGSLSIVQPRELSR